MSIRYKIGAKTSKEAIMKKDLKTMIMKWALSGDQ